MGRGDGVLGLPPRRGPRARAAWARPAPGAPGEAAVGARRAGPGAAVLGLQSSFAMAVLQNPATYYQRPRFKAGGGHAYTPCAKTFLAPGVRAYALQVGKYTSQRFKEGLSQRLCSPLRLTKGFLGRVLPKDPTRADFGWSFCASPPLYGIKKCDIVVYTL